MRLVWCRTTGVLLLMVLLAAHITPFAHAEQTAPQSMIYDGRLLDQNGNPHQTDHVLRFSAWIGGDVDENVFDENHEIDENATGFTGWQEEHTISPDGTGFFQVELGSVGGFLDFATIDPADMANLNLQIEVKPVGEPDSAFVLLDSNAASDTQDRSTFTSVPFAMNANFLDNRSVGTNEGDVPVIGAGGQFSITLIPGGTNASVFILDHDNTETEEIILQFGQQLEKQLSYDVMEKIFNINDDVRIQGDLTVEGLINNVDISALGGPQNADIVLHPEFRGATYVADGSANVGQLHTMHDTVAGLNYYQWTSSRPALQDYDIVLPYRLPPTFVAWDGQAPFSLTYRTKSGDTVDNHIDIMIKDTAGNPVTLSGSTAGLASQAWDVTHFSFADTPTWEANRDILIAIRVHAKEGKEAHVGPLHIRYLMQ